MRIESLSLEQFRSYERLVLALSERERQVFVGDNGEGKTNIVEAVSYLSMGRSCLRAQSDDVPHWGTDFFRVRADTIADDGTKRSVEFVWQRVPRRSSAMFVQDVRVPLLQFIGVLPTIVFLPQDLDLFTGSPSARRGFLDALLSQLKPDFAALRLEYERILKQRNAIIARVSEGEAGTEELDLWDDRLTQTAARLITLRNEAVDLFNRDIGKILSGLGEGEWSDATMIHDRKTTGTEVDGLEIELKGLLRAARERDLLVRTTTVGPHRDDWHLQAENHNIATFASRGQQRAAFIGLLLASAGLFRDVRHERPVILLDDVLSELDETHQAALLDALEGHQVLITATHPVPLKKDRELWTVSNRSVKTLDQ